VQAHPDALVYTHPGAPAYCGMNSAGLCVLCLYIDDGVQGEGGVPIDAAIREVSVLEDRVALSMNKSQLMADVRRPWCTPTSHRQCAG